MRSTMIAMLTGIAVTVSVPALAQGYVMFPGSSGRPLAPGELSALSCDQLWVARNEIYHRNGYCFKTRRGISFFGNAGCWTDNAGLNTTERNNVAGIQHWERRYGC